MIDALVGGTLYGRAQARTSKNGQPYVTAKVRAPMRDGESLFINVVAFSASVVQTLLALEESDAVALAGELKAHAYLNKAGEPRPSIDLLAHGVLTAYHVKRKRETVKAAKAGASQSTPEAPHSEPESAQPEAGFNDEIPF
jgi:single-stranded DNA-binding protein